MKQIVSPCSRTAAARVLSSDGNDPDSGGRDFLESVDWGEVGQ